MTVIGSVLTQYEALVAALAAPGHRVGLGRPPADKTTPYVVVWPGEAGWDGPVRDPQADSALSAQLTYIGTSPSEAMWLQDSLRPIVLSLLELGTDRAVMETPQLVLSRRLERDDDIPGKPLFYMVDVFQIRTTPGLTVGGFSGYPALDLYPSDTLYPIGA